MTSDQFTILWDKLKDSYPNAFDDDDHEDRVFADWYSQFQKYEYDVAEAGFTYFFNHLSAGYRKFPERFVLINCCNQESRSKVDKSKFNYIAAMKQCLSTKPGLKMYNEHVKKYHNGRYYKGSRGVKTRSWFEAFSDMMQSEIVEPATGHNQDLLEDLGE